MEIRLTKKRANGKEKEVIKRVDLDKIKLNKTMEWLNLPLYNINIIRLKKDNYILT